MSQDPATIFRGLSLQCGIEVEIKMFEKNIHCSLLLSAFLGFNSLTVCKLFFKAWVLVVQNRIPPSDFIQVHLAMSLKTHSVKGSLRINKVSILENALMWLFCQTSDF